SDVLPTTRFPSALIESEPPSGVARNQYFPGPGRRMCVTKIDPIPALDPPGTPIGSLRAVVSWEGRALRPVPTQIPAVGVVITRDWASTTRKETRFWPGW